MKTRAFQLPCFVLLATCLALGACTKNEVKDATEVIVVVDSDEQLKTDLALIHVDVLDEDGEETASTHEFELDADTKWPLSFGVYQPPGGAEWFRLVTRGVDAAGTTLVEHKAIVQFKAGRTTREITLSSACAGQFCTGAVDQTCNAKTGQCETVTRTPTSVVVDGDGGSQVVAEDAGLDGSLAPPDAGQEDAGQEEAGAGGDAATMITPPVPPSLAGAVSFGGRRTDGTITVYDDGFEQGARICTADGQFCVTGGFSP